MTQTSGESVDRSVVFHLVRAMRPHHWIKNIIVFAAPLFALALSPPDLLNTGAAFVLFSLMASSFYLLNDVNDRKQDQLHPEKKQRPVASGDLPVSIAMTTGIIFMIGSMGAGFALSTGFGIVLLSYMVIQLGYNLGLKQLPVLDIMTISAGFILRAIGGAVAVGVPASSWFLLCVGLLAFFLGIEKRKAELDVLSDNSTRHVLNIYSMKWLERMESVVSASALMAYSLWAIEAAKTEWMLATVPFVAYAIFKYQYYSEHGQGERPELVMLKEPSVIITVILWGLTSLVILKLA